MTSFTSIHDLQHQFRLIANDFHARYRDDFCYHRSRWWGKVDTGDRWMWQPDMRDRIIGLIEEAARKGPPSPEFERLYHHMFTAWGQKQITGYLIILFTDHRGLTCPPPSSAPAPAPEPPAPEAGN